MRPTTGLWTGYRRADRGPAALEVARGLFDPDILVLSQVAGPSLPVVSTLAVTKALRETIMSRAAQPVPDWVSGHRSDGQPLRDGKGHMALVPLPFVGHEHADGHLLGVALVFPQSVPRKERGHVLGKLLVDKNGLPETVQLTLGRLGVWDVQKRDWQEQRDTLQPRQWTAAGAAPEGAATWASVTPVVLDRFPKANRSDPSQRLAWEDEVRQIVRDACSRIGLPEPQLIDVDTTSWYLGSPRGREATPPSRPHRVRDPRRCRPWRRLSAVSAKGNQRSTPASSRLAPVFPAGGWTSHPGSGVTKATVSASLWGEQGYDQIVICTIQ